MAFDVGGAGQRVRPVMNVTPLVDVVLVLLIIFMVITPLLSKHFSVDVPIKEDKPADSAAVDPTPPLILRIDQQGQAFINQDPVADAELGGRLERVFAARDDRTLFFDADEDAPFGRAVEIMDLARGGGAFTIAVITEPLEHTP